MSTPLPLVAPDEAEPLPREPQTDFNFAQYLGWVQRWWKLVAAACLVAMAAGAIHYLVAPGPTGRPRRSRSSGTRRPRP